MGSPLNCSNDVADSTPHFRLFQPHWLPVIREGRDIFTIEQEKYFCLQGSVLKSDESRVLVRPLAWFKVSVGMAMRAALDREEESCRVHH